MAYCLRQMVEDSESPEAVSGWVIAAHLAHDLKHLTESVDALIKGLPKAT
jgi:hypothetical protein